MQFLAPAFIEREVFGNESQARLVKVLPRCLYLQCSPYLSAARAAGVHQDFGVYLQIATMHGNDKLF